MKDVLEDAKGRILVFPVEGENFNKLMIKENGKWQIACITSEELLDNFKLIEDEERAEALYEESKERRVHAMLDYFAWKVEMSTRLKKGPEAKWEIRVYDNFGERDLKGYSHGFYDSEEEAVAEAKRMLDEDIANIFKNKPGISADDAFMNYGLMGYEPSISGSRFDGWDYAKEKCKELAERKKATS
jgi:hypothetical protein